MSDNRRGAGLWSRFRRSRTKAGHEVRPSPGVGGGPPFARQDQCLLSATDMGVVSEVAVRSSNPASLTPVHA